MNRESAGTPHGSETAGDPAPRGECVIRQGYASGAIVQYEVRPDGGGLFMASERDLRRP